VAVVGTRRPTAIGRGTAARIADAAAGLGATIVSGLALGIDTAAHRAAVGAAGTTVAVIGGGHERLYPAANRDLARLIVRGGGAVISEFHPETVPSRGTFPRRNRIISGLADATVVVEAGARSGALTTAAWALEQGRGLYIVPGRLDDPAVAGSLAFLREAGPEARIVAGVPELLEDLGLLTQGAEGAGHVMPVAAPDGAAPPPAASLEAVLASLPPVERQLAREVVAGRGSVDELVAATSLAGATVLGALTALEIRGFVVETFGRYRPSGVLASSGSPRPAWRPSPGGATLPATRQPTPT
jgi:DNA processing protein